jgi:endo-1,4-beta-xylanase
MIGKEIPMKQAMIIAIACLVLFAAAGCATAPPPEKDFPAPTEGLIADAVYGTPAAIDGTLDPAFAKAPVIETKQKTMGDKSATATARVVWDMKYVYVFMEVQDPKLSDVNKNPWEQDSIEVFIDESDSKAEKYVAGDAQYRVNYKNVVTGGTGADLKKVKSGAKITADGYNVTVAVPFLATTPVAGSYIGFDLQVNDDDGSGARTGQRNWCDDTNNGWRYPTVFGNLHLRSK